VTLPGAYAPASIALAGIRAHKSPHPQHVLRQRGIPWGGGGINDVRQTKMHTAEPLVPELTSFEIEVATETLKNTHHQVLSKFLKNWSKKEEIHYVTISTNLLITFLIRKNCHSSGRNPLFHLIERAIKVTVVIIEGHTIISYIQNCMQYSCLKVNSICRRNYLETSVWIST
jgi:hypothetical protein